MVDRLQVYKCELCGNIVEVVHGGDGELTCCNQAMVLQEEKTADAATEKHVPVVEESEGGVKVAVGSVPHPMEPEHYIEWIEVQSAGAVEKVYLEPGQSPEAVFAGLSADGLVAREYCSVHGLWKG